MRNADRVGRTVTLRLRFDDFTRATRSETMLMPTASTEPILKIARQLLAGAGPLIRSQGLTLIGLSVSNLTNPDVIQLALPFDRPGFEALDRVMDDLKKRFGSESVSRAVLLGKDRGLTLPMLPD
jgi:DNA polymerase-4